MPKTPTTLVGKTVRMISKLRGGNGSALPGLVVERIDSSYVPTMLGKLPHGVVVISGTNGKTTTTKMVVELLESQGLKVFTNRTGSNFVRGVAAAIIGDVDLRGRLNADIAVLELDEAHAVHFVRAVQPRYSLLLNVMRDQLDRFGEIDTTATMLRHVAEATSEKVIINREDPRLLQLSHDLPAEKVEYFGLAADLRKEFPSDDTMRGASDESTSADLPPARAVLERLDGQHAHFRLRNASLEARLKLDGIYNVFNAAAALGLVATIVGETLDMSALVKKLQTITPAFGRGEILTVHGQPCELVLVKNPSGFRLGLKSFSPKGYVTMIAINDNYADGRDMSWLWDVDFDSLCTTGVAMISGVRAYDMALRLQYDEVPAPYIEPNLASALKQFLQHNDSPKRIYCTYTAMLALRHELSKITDVEKVQ